ncbi:MAG: hypothetical protein HQM04_06655 [Magnetococcales bacterium]|nr:hypothetical protein [Magnetococcales bacterium]MBF0114707.1 hypothetical protein [Magnetococcales bacterium]
MNQELINLLTEEDYQSEHDEVQKEIDSGDFDPSDGGNFDDTFQAGYRHGYRAAMVKVCGLVDLKGLAKGGQ